MDDLTSNPRFTGIFIPVEILEDSDLSMLEQLLLSWIDALYKEEYGGCFAKNEYFAKRFGRRGAFDGDGSRNLSCRRPQ